MKTIYILATLLLMACIAPVSTTAQDIPTAKADSIRALMQVMGVNSMGKQMMEQMLVQFRQIMPEVPESLWAEIMSDENLEDLFKELIPIYDRNYTQEEIDAMLAFYRSDVGRSVLSKMPIVMQESMVAGQQWGARVGDRVSKRLEAKGYKKI